MGRNRHDEMIILHAVAIIGSQEKPITMMVDTGCSNSTMPEGQARKLGLPLRRQRTRRFASLADGSTHPIDFMAILTFRLGPSYTCSLKIDIGTGTLDPEDMLLGMDWMRSVNPKISFKPLSLKITDKYGKSWEVIGMRPPGSPYYCPNHGYQCKDKGRGGSYGIPGGLRAGGGGLGHRSPFGGFGQGIPVFRSEVVGMDRLPCTCEQTGNGEKKWVDWRELFPDREWYSKSSKNESNVNATQKLRLLQDQKADQKKSSRPKNKEALRPRTVPNAKGRMPLTPTKRKHDNYDFFR